MSVEPKVGQEWESVDRRERGADGTARRFRITHVGTDEVHGRIVQSPLKHQIGRPCVVGRNRLGYPGHGYKLVK